MKNFKTAYSVLFLFLFLGKSTAQNIDPQLDFLLSETLDSMKKVLGVKSLGAAMQFPDDQVWARSVGISEEDPDTVEVSPDHRYCIGSITKTITSACVLQLADEGILNLDDSLHEWLDTFPFVNPNITIRQLLRHQSGLYDVITNPAYNTANNAQLDSVWSLKNLIKDYIKAPLFAPGAGWSYSNTNYVLLGLIIEKATGSNYFSEYRSRFFTPLGLGSFALMPYDPTPEPRAHVWLNLGGPALEDADWFFSNWTSFFTSAGPAGGYFATPTDVAKWTRAFMSGKLHTPGMMAQAKTVVTAPGLPNGTKYGLGLMSRKMLGLDALGHGGDIGYSSFALYFPQKDVSIAVLNNDQKKTSWMLQPVIQALLKTCMDYQMSVAVSNPLKVNELEINFSPNPFSEKLDVSLVLPQKSASVEVVLTNLMGQKMAAISVENLPEGRQFLEIPNLGNLPSGVYFAQIFVENRLVGSSKILK